MNKMLTKFGQVALTALAGYELGKGQERDAPEPVVVKIDKDMLDNKNTVDNEDILLLIVIIVLIFAIITMLALCKKMKPRKENAIPMRDMHV